MIDLAWTAAGNAVFAGGGMAVAVAVLALARRHEPGWARLFRLGAALCGAGVSLRIGFWLLAIWGRIPPASYASWHEDWRAAVTLAGACLFVAGVTCIIASVRRSGRWWQWTLFGLGWAATFAGLGYWGAL